MKAIVLHLGPNFENKWSELHDLELKYLTNEQEPIHTIINSQSLFYSCFFRVSLGFVANTAGAHTEPVMIITLGFTASVCLLTFSFILYMFSMWCLLSFIFRTEIRTDLNAEHCGFTFLKSPSREKKSCSLTLWYLLKTCLLIKFFYYAPFELWIDYVDSLTKTQ